MDKQFEEWWKKYYSFDNPNLARSHPKGDCKIVWNHQQKEIDRLNDMVFRLGTKKTELVIDNQALRAELEEAREMNRDALKLVDFYRARAFNEKYKRGGGGRESN